MRRQINNELYQIKPDSGSEIKFRVPVTDRMCLILIVKFWDQSSLHYADFVSICGFHYPISL